MISDPVRINTAIEKKIVTGMIVSSRYLAEIHPILQKGLKFEYFKNKFTRTVAKWCITYYNKYERAPFIHIEDIYWRHKDVDLKDDDEADLIAKLLTEVSARHELNPNINVDYLLDHSLEYFEKRELEVRMNNVQILLDQGKILDAKEQYLMYNAPERQMSHWINISADTLTNALFGEKTPKFFNFPGQLGEFLGELDRGWFVAITGPFKRGKSYLMMEFAVIGILSGLSVAFFSLEMNKKDTLNRIARRLTGFVDDGSFTYPCFDCLHNQTNSCNIPQRTNQTALLDPKGEKPEYNMNIKYKVCNWCRKHDPHNYEQATWFEEIQRPLFEKDLVHDYFENFEKQYGSKLRIYTYPRFSAGVREIKRDLNILERTEMFRPDIIIVDYADILKAEDPRMASGVEKEDITWMSLGGLAGERNAMVVTGTQATKAALDVKNVKAKHTARWIGKLGHVDVMLTLNQQEEEKKAGVMRIGIMEHRHRFFLENQTVAILQKLGAGQVHLDSQI